MSKSSDTILVTGAAGFIGSHAAEALLDRGLRVVGVDNFCDFYDRSWKQMNLQSIRGSRKFDVEEIALVQSRLEPGGSRYETIEIWPVG